MRSPDAINIHHIRNRLVLCDGRSRSQARRDAGGNRDIRGNSARIVERAGPAGKRANTKIRDGIATARTCRKVNVRHGAARAWGRA